jgi:hypothetical protein
MLTVTYVECRYAECRYAECRGALLECQSTVVSMSSCVHVNNLSKTVLVV